MDNKRLVTFDDILYSFNHHRNPSMMPVEIYTVIKYSTVDSIIDLYTVRKWKK